MRLYQQLGRPQAALRQFEACRAILREELDVEPWDKVDLVSCNYLYSLPDGLPVIGDGEP